MIIVYKTFPSIEFYYTRQGHLISGLVNGNGYHTIMSSGTTTNWIRANYFSGA